MDAAFVWLTIALMAIVTYTNRALLVILAGRIELPGAIRRALNYVPPAVLTALVVPAFIMPAEGLDISLANERLFAGLAAAAAAYRWRHILLTIVVGMASLHLWRFASTL
jgi:branched-subunit amino acid transport protein